MRDTAQQTLLQGNVTNPFHISNFESLRTSNPALYQRLAGNAFFTSTTIQRQFLIRGFPEYGTRQRRRLQRAAAREEQDACARSERQRRYANGVAGNFSYMFTHSDDLIRVETYERAPTLVAAEQQRPAAPDQRKRHG